MKKIILTSLALLSFSTFAQSGNECLDKFLNKPDVQEKLLDKADERLLKTTQFTFNQLGIKTNSIKITTSFIEPPTSDDVSLKVNGRILTDRSTLVFSEKNPEKPAKVKIEKVVIRDIEGVPQRVVCKAKAVHFYPIQNKTYDNHEVTGINLVLELNF
jgi:hypothetical protein